MTLIAVFSTLRLRTLCTFSHEPPHMLVLHGVLVHIGRRDWLLSGACHGAGYMLVLHVVLVHSR